MVGTTACKIDATDYGTDLQGDVIIASPAAGETLYVWTGALDAAVGAQTDLFDLDIKAGDTSVVAAAATATIKVTTSLPDGAASTNCDGSSGGSTACMIARYGTVVSYTLQLQDLSNGQTVDAKPPAARAEATVTVNYKTSLSNGSIADVVAGSHPTSFTTYKFNADGQITFDVTMADPAATTKDDVNGNGDITEDGDRYSRVEVVVASTAVSTAPTVNPIRFTDDAPRLTTVTAAVASSNYALSPGAGGTAVIPVTASAFNQYGDGVSGIRLAIDADNGGTIAPAEIPSARYTLSGGKTTLHVTRTVIGAAPQTFRVISDPVLSTNIFEDAAATATDGSALPDPVLSAATGVTVYWATTPTSTGDVTAAAVAAGNIERSEVVVDTSTPSLVYFDSNDQFTVAVTAALAANFGLAEAGNVYGLENFTKALGMLAAVNPKATATARVGVSSYNPSDSAHVASWTLSFT